MMEYETDQNAWKCFEQSGKISDYLKYSEYKQDAISKVGTNAAKNSGNNFEATEYR